MMQRYFIKRPNDEGVLESYEIKASSIDEFKEEAKRLSKEDAQRMKDLGKVMRDDVSDVPVPTPSHVPVSTDKIEEKLQKIEVKLEVLAELIKMFLKI